jgi:hypothetical protein
LQCKRNGPIYTAILCNDGRPVATNIGGGHEHPFTQNEMDANAALIAAAPDLLDALRTVRMEIDEFHAGRNPDTTWTVLAVINAAIDKATAP